MTGSELRTLRQQLHLSQVELARILGVDGVTISRWERGVQPISHPRILALALDSLTHDTPGTTVITMRDISSPVCKQAGA